MSSEDGSKKAEENKVEFRMEHDAFHVIRGKTRVYNGVNPFYEEVGNTASIGLYYNRGPSVHVSTSQYERQLSRLSWKVNKRSSLV